MLPASKDPPEMAAPWSERGSPFNGGLPSWMAPKSEDGPHSGMTRASQRPHSSPPPSRSPSQLPSVPPSPQVVLSSRPPTLPPPIRDYEGEIAALQAQVEACVRTMSRMRRRVFEASERQLVQLAVVVAEKVVGRELEADQELFAQWAREGVSALLAEDSLTVTVSPDVAAVLQDVDAWPSTGSVSVVVDEGLEPGSCEVRGEVGKVDASVRARVAAMCETLGVDEEDDAQV